MTSRSYADTCRSCGEPLPQPTPGGRRQRFCDDACRKRYERSETGQLSPRSLSGMRDVHAAEAITHMNYFVPADTDYKAVNEHLAAKRC